MKRSTLSLAAFLLTAPVCAGVHETMESLSSHAGAVNSALIVKDAASMERNLTEMEDLFSRLAVQYDPSYGGDPGHWKENAERARALCAETRQTAAAGEWDQARKKFKGLRDVEKQGHNEFRPGLFKRLARMFKKSPHPEAAQTANP